MFNRDTYLDGYINKSIIIQFFFGKPHLNQYQDHILSRTIFVMFIHSHKIRKDILGGGLDRVLFTAEPEFSKILVPRLLQHTSDVNTEYVGKSKQLQTLCDQPPGVLISLYYLDYFFVLILICVSINYAW